MRIENFVLRQRSIWFHIIATYFTAGIWIIVYYHYKNKDGKIKQQHFEPYIFPKDKNIGVHSVGLENRGYDCYSESCTSLYSKNNIKKFVNDYVVFDLETTGFDKDKDDIIEIGAVRYINNEIAESFNVLVNPGYEIPDKITKITGITNEMIKGCNSIDIEIRKFIDFIGDYTLVAHNGSFDLGFIESNLLKCKMPIIKNKNIDTLYMSKKYIYETDNHKLETLKKYFKIEEISHRAINDCNVTNYVYQECKKRSCVKKEPSC